MKVSQMNVKSLKPTVLFPPTILLMKAQIMDVCSCNYIMYCCNYISYVLLLATQLSSPVWSYYPAI